MRSTLLIFMAILLSTLASFGQRYRDVFPQVVGADDDYAFDILNSYLQTDPDNPNANLRIAKIYLSRYKQIDILREYERALALAEQAKYKLIKAKVTVTDKEVKKNDEYYIGILPDGQLSYQAIATYIDTEYAAVEEFMEKLPPIYTEFTKSVEKYDQAVKSYAEIVGAHTSLKELYLLFDEDLGISLQALKVNYDSTKIYFDNYLKLREAYNVNAVNQNYSETPIKVYRLDGLVTQINFIQPQIMLWDYASWVDSVSVVVGSNISTLRADLIKNDKKLKEALVRVKTVEFPDSFKVVKVDKALIFNLMKYDYKNSLVPYLNYQEFKQTLIVDQKRKIYFDTAMITVDRKLAYFNDMMYSAKRADSIIHDFELKFNTTQLSRHQEFIDESFGSAESLKKYMGDEKVENKALFMSQVENIKSSILISDFADTAGIEVKHRKMIIPTFVVDKPVTELEVNYLQTQHILSSADESKYIAGHQITDPKLQNTEVAIAKLSAENKVIWFKSMDFEIDSAGADANHYLGDVRITSEGVIAIIRSIALDQSQVINTIIHLTSDGEVKFTKRIKTELFPRELLYDERSNLFILSFFGDNDMMDVKSNSELSVRGVNGLGDEVWHYDVAYSGNYLQMLTTQSQILLSGNYSLIKNEAGRTFSKPSGTNGFIMSLDYSGALKKIKCYASDADYEITTFHKVSDRNLNLIGNKGEHIIVDGSLENIYSSIVLK